MGNRSVCFGSMMTSCEGRTWTTRSRGRIMSAIARRQQSRNSSIANNRYAPSSRPRPIADAADCRLVRYDTRRSANAGSNASVRIRPGSSAPSAWPMRALGIAQPSLRGRGRDGLVESARLSPRATTRRGDAIASLTNGLVADGDGLVPAVNESIALEPRHELVERGARASDTEVGDHIADDAARLLTRENDAECEELQVR